MPPIFDNLKDLEMEIKKNPGKYIEGAIIHLCPNCNNKGLIIIKSSVGICQNCNAEIDVEFDIV